MSNGLSHIAMSVAEGTLTDEYRAELIDFYGSHFGWHEIESLRKVDRLTVAIGGGCYVNIRERAQVMVTSGYEHFGLLVASTEDAERAYAALSHDERDVNLEELSSGADGYRSFRFRYLIPFAAEVQYFPPALTMFKD